LPCKRGKTVLDYSKFVKVIPAEKWETLADKLIDFILTSKSDEKMPSQLANAVLYHWQHDALKSETGIALMLEAAVLLEPEKTFNALNELQMAKVAEQIKEATEP